MHNGIAEKRMVKVGLSNADYVELETNIAPGETVVISDMSSYEHMEKVQVRK